MNSQLRARRAGSSLLPALLFLFHAAVPGGPDTATTSTLDRLAASLWMDTRGYSSLEPPERYQKMRQDLAFDAFVASRARTEGIPLQNPDLAILQESRQQFEFGLARQRLQARLNPSAEDIAREAERWTIPLPELWEVDYLFIDTTAASTTAQQDALRRQALRIRENLTPENFRDMARLWSDAATSVQGGALGAIRLDGMGPTFADHVRRTPPGTIGGPYPTASGWNILYVRSHVPPRERSFSAEQLDGMTREVQATNLLKERHRSPESWRQTLAELEVDQDPELKFCRTALENALLAERFFQARVNALPAPSEKTLRAIYEENRDHLKAAPRRHARELLLTSDDWTSTTTREAWQIRRAVRDRARDLRQRCLDGEDFAEVARRYSAAPSASLGGDLGWIQEPSIYYIDLALQDLQPGEISPPISVPNGYLLLQLVKKDSDRTLPFSESRETCRQIWKNRQRKTMESEMRSVFQSRINTSLNP